MRTFFLTPIAVLILAVVAASCGGGAADPVVEDTPNSSNDVVVDGVETDETDEAGEADDVIVPPTLKPGSAPVLGELESEIQAVSDECSDELAPIRALYDVYPSGLEMNADDLETFNAALSAGFSACDADDWTEFQQFELAGWMNAIPSS